MSYTQNIITNKFYIVYTYIHKKKSKDPTLDNCTFKKTIKPLKS